MSPGDAAHARVPREDRPPVAIVFWTFRIMLAIGTAMLAIAVLGLLFRRREEPPRWYLRCWVAMLPSGFVAVLAGWFTAEIGRQPWVVYGLMRTADANTAIGAGSVLASLVAFALVYAIVFGAGTYYLLKLLKKGPVEIEAKPPTTALLGSYWTPKCGDSGSRSRRARNGSSCCANSG